MEKKNTKKFFTKLLIHRYMFRLFSNLPSKMLRETRMENINDALKKREEEKDINIEYLLNIFSVVRMKL